MRLPYLWLGQLCIGEGFSGKSFLIGVAFNMERRKSGLIVKLT